ncbi:hypothetical protein RHGRI_005754 [Rhododendron griersonianum]|uniref:Uncharacterized protein n=1 Tax=Rhododendron griersonianum TaxID=479676 RepID=A0AAV6LDD1_9ERIC|nr:hypothetical protein RHGRI_005754 [Rhododendron griersonianum]
MSSPASSSAAAFKISVVSMCGCKTGCKSMSTVEEEESFRVVPSSKQVSSPGSEVSKPSEEDDDVDSTSEDKEVNGTKKKVSEKDNNTIGRSEEVKGDPPINTKSDAAPLENTTCQVIVNLGIQNLSMHEEKVDMEDVEEVAETNEEVGQVEGTDEGLLRLKNMGLQGGNSDMAARDTFSSSGIANSVRGSGTVRVSMEEGVGKIEIPITNLAPLIVIGLNRILLLPRARLSNLVENRDNWVANSVSWVADSVNETSASPGILRESNEEGAANDEGNIAVQNLSTHNEDEPILAPLKAAINGVQGKKKRKSIYDILGFSKVN